MLIFKQLTLGSFFILSGCVSFAPEFERPVAPIPQQFSLSQNGLITTENYRDPGWRQFFSDPASIRFIEQTLNSHTDLKMAILKVKEAQAKYNISDSERYPQVTGQTSMTSQGGFTGEKRASESYEAGISLSFEPDFWGRLKNLNEADLQNFLATEEAQRTVQILLITTAMESYYRYQLALEQQAISVENAKNYQQSYQFIEKRLSVGSSDILAVEQARGQTESANADIAARNGEIKQALNALHRISGDYAFTMSGADTFASSSKPLVVLPDNLSSMVLLQRPDIQEAEHLLLAANANIGVARAAFFPSVSLTGGISGNSSNLSSLFDSATGMWNFIPKITLPIFNAGRNQANLALATFQQQQAILVYEQRIQDAFKEVADTLAQRDSLANQIDAQARYLVSLNKTVQRAEVLFSRGQGSYLDVLDAQRARLTTRQTLATLEYDQKINEIKLFAALGGGWKA